MITLEEAKAYLRVDSSDEDGLIESILASAEALCMDVARLETDEWDVISSYKETSRRTITIHSNVKHKGEILHMQKLIRVAVLYALGYLFEHREEADHHDLVLMLRSLLFEIREGVV